MAQVGGAKTALVAGGQLFTAVFSYKLMMSSLIGKMFYFKPRFKGEIKQKKGAKKIKGKEAL